MTPKIEWCNWVFDYMDTNKWIVKRDCCDDAASMCPNCGKFVNGVNPYDDGETWMM